MKQADTISCQAMRKESLSSAFLPHVKTGRIKFFLLGEIGV